MKIKQKARVRSRHLNEYKHPEYSVTLRLPKKNRIRGDFGSDISVKGKGFYDAVSIGDEVTITVEVKS